MNNKDNISFIFVYFKIVIRKNFLLYLIKFVIHIRYVLSHKFDNEGNYMNIRLFHSQN